MTERFVFWAQALDNSSPDHIEIRTEELSAEDMVRRQEAVSLVSSVVKAGRRVFDSQGVQLIVDGCHFVVEVQSTQRDRAGRKAPIVCYGDYDETVGEAFGSAVAAGIGDFATRIGRSLQPQHLELACESFTVLKKKSSTRKLQLLVAIGAAILVILWLACWLDSGGSQEEQWKTSGRPHASD